MKYGRVGNIRSGLTLLFCMLVLGAVAQPNVIIILTDDQGYQDLGCYGSPDIETPRIDELAKEGIRFTSFYVGSSVCSASRASLLTGRMPARHGVHGAFFPELGSMALAEVTLAEVLKSAGYKTACFGKWHLGDDPEHLPLAQGFDEFYGIPYSNDMYIGPNQSFADNVVFREGYSLTKAKADQKKVAEIYRTEKGQIWPAMRTKAPELICKVPLMEDDKIVEYPADQKKLTMRYFDRAIDFIDRADDHPFLVYITPAMPHWPLHASEAFKGKSKRGPYGDVVQEIDWNIGRLLDHLEAKGLDENTMIIFTSDNGPADGAGCAKPLRDGKFSIYEGGVRVPGIMRWEGHWPANQTSSETVVSADLLPTIANYAGASMPNFVLDGINVSAHLEDPSKPVDRNVLIYGRTGNAEGVQQHGWKLLLHNGTAPWEVKEKGGPELYNLNEDVSETINLANQYPEKVEQLKKEIAEFDASIKSEK